MSHDPSTEPWDLAGRHVLLTGGSSGIGHAAADALAAHGAHLIVTGRHEGRLSAAAARLRRRHPAASIAPLRADFTDLDSVRALAQQVTEHWGHIDMLIHNAGGMRTRLRRTAQGHEETWGTNHLAPVCLTLDLLPLLRAAPAARLIWVSSSAHWSGTIPLDDLDWHATPYRAFGAYAHSKLANLLTARHLARALSTTTITSHAMHPGLIRTHFGAAAGWLIRLVFWTVARTWRSPRHGARTIVHLATTSDLGGSNGDYWVDEAPARSSDASQDAGLAARLWMATLEQLGAADPFATGRDAEA